MARRRRGRDIDGVILLDKPVGCSSNAALQRVRRAFDARKAGHTGSLDPLAGGLLPVCLGEATKVSSYLLHADKHYRVRAALGAETETGDREGEVTHTRDMPVPVRPEFEALLEGFRGPQQQIPPMYSALKRDGQPLYVHARAGRTVERAPRPIVVHALTLVEVDAEGFVLEVAVSAGTYVRTLVEDIARAFGGRAHVAELRRTRVGRLGADMPMIALADIERRVAADEELEALLWPVSSVVWQWPQVVLDDTQATAIGHGRAIDCAAARTLSRDAVVRLQGSGGKFYGLGVADGSGQLSPKRLFARVQR